MWAFVIVLLAGLALYRGWRRSGQRFKEYLSLVIVRLYTGLWHRWRSNRPPRWGLRGPAILLSNHTSSPDPVFLMSGVKGFISFLVAREHWNVSPPTRWILEMMDCVPVSRNGRDATCLRVALKRLEAGYIVGVFPEGNLTGVLRNRVRPGKAGVAYLALRTRVPVIPAYIAGGPRTPKLLKAWLSPSKRAVEVVYGPPVDLSAYYGRRLDRPLLEEVTTHLMAHVAALAPKPRRRAPTPVKEGSTRGVLHCN